MVRNRLSVNASLDKLPILKKLGFSYIELSNNEIMAMDSLSFEDAIKDLEESKICCAVIDNPIPCSEDFSSDEWDVYKWKDYLELSAKRARKIGAKYWCIGNGSSRLIKDNAAQMNARFYAIIKFCAEVANKYGLSIIVEPLGPSVTNYLLSVKETVAFIDEVDMENVYTMVDYRWEYEQNRPMSDLYDCSNRIVHAHIDNPTTDYKNLKIRKPPMLSDKADYSEFFKFISSGKFDGVMSIEANSFDDYEADLSESIALYREYNLI